MRHSCCPWRSRHRASRRNKEATKTNNTTTANLGDSRASRVPVFYTPAYGAAAEDFDTFRKSRWVAESLLVRPIPGLVIRRPRQLTRAALCAVHAAEYVDAVRTGEPRFLAESSGFSWDRGVWQAVRASNGGAVAAALHAFRARAHAGSLSSGLHHARRNMGAGFCTFNGLALAVHAVLAAGARGVLVLDLDAHCGGGTQSLVCDLPGVVHVDVAVSAFDCYTPDPAGRSSLDVISRVEDYLPVLRRRLAALDDTPLDLVVLNAGMDPHEDCGIGGLPEMTAAVLAERERTVFDWARARGIGVAFVLAGGYTGGRLDREALVALHRLTIRSAGGQDVVVDEAGPFRSFIDDNFHHMDEGSRTTGPVFPDYEKALRWTCAVVDASLCELWQPGITPPGLLSQYRMFGDDPWISPTPPPPARLPTHIVALLTSQGCRASTRRRAGPVSRPHRPMEAGAWNRCRVACRSVP